MYADATMRRLLGISEAPDLTPEAVYRTWYSRIHASHYEKVNESVEKMISGIHAEVQYPWLHPTRGEIWVRCAGLLDRTYTKGVRLQGRHQDVSDVVHIQLFAERREVELRAAAEKEALLSGITKTLYGYDLRVDLDTLKYTVIPGTGMESSVAFLLKSNDYNVAYEKKLSHVLGTNSELGRVLAPENLRKVARAGHSGLYSTLEYPIRLSTGYTGWEEMSVFVDTDSNGRPQCNVLIRDVTEVHERAARRERELRAAAAKDALLSNITKTLYGYNLTVDLQTLKYEFIKGSGMDDLVAFIAEHDDYATIAAYGLQLAAPEYHEQLTQTLSAEALRKAAAEGRTGLLGTFEYEVFFEGASRWQELSVFIGSNESGVPEASILGRDITEQHRQLEDRLQAEREVNAAKSYFFSTVSHDIRTPLNAIIGFSELLEAGVQDEAERTSYLASIRSSSKVLMDLINDVLDLSKLEAGKMDIVTEPTDLRPIVEEIRAAFGLETARKGLSLAIEFEDIPACELDPQRIRQVLFNLVGNAVKFTEKGGITIRARKRPSTVEGCCGLELEVSDTGCGIAQADQAKLMVPFVQVHGQGRHGGTGLGLAICRQLAQRMGGELTLRSLYGRGSTFALILPQVRIAAAGKTSVAAPVAIAPTKLASAAAKRVLVVDDSTVNLAVLRALLARSGCKDIVTAEDGRVALAHLLGEGPRFDLVLTDLWMPNMDGESLVRAIRSNPKFVGLPVYAVTADVEAQKDYAAAGFTGLLLKPLTLSSLATVLV